MLCIVQDVSVQKPRKVTPGGKEQEMKFGVIEQKVIIGASPLEVYRAYVYPKNHAAFTGTKVTGVPREGGRFTAGDGYITGKHIKLESGKRITQEWITTEWPVGYPPSILELTLKPKGTGTELTMIHSKVPAEQVGYYTKGWNDFYWGPLKKYFDKASKPKQDR